MKLYFEEIKNLWIVKKFCMLETDEFVRVRGLFEWLFDNKN